MRMIDGNLGSFVVEMMAKPSLQRRLTESIIERALSRDVNEDEYILLEEGKWIKMSNLLSYRYIQRALHKVNKSFITRIGKGRFNFQYGGGFYLNGATTKPNFSQLVRPLGSEDGGARRKQFKR